MKYQFHMESGWSGPNDEEYFQDIVEGVKKLECYFILWIYESYIQQTKHDGICGYILLIPDRLMCTDGMRIVKIWCSIPCTKAKETLDYDP